MLARRKTPAEYRGDDSGSGSGSDSYGKRVRVPAESLALRRETCPAVSGGAAGARDEIPHSFTSGSAAEAFLHQ